MSAFDDDESMGAWSDEELLHGAAVDAEPTLTALVAALRESADAPAPRPTHALEMMLRTGRAPVPVTLRSPTAGADPLASPLGTRLRRLASRAAALGLAAKIALTAGVAVASVGAAAATIEGVPAVVQERAAATLGRIVEVFTSGDHGGPERGGSVVPGRAPGGDGAVPGVPSDPASRHPVSPTDLPTPAESGRERPGPAPTNRAEVADGAGGASHDPSSAPDRTAHPPDPAGEPNRGAVGSRDALPNGQAAHAAVPGPVSSAEPSRDTRGG